MMTEKSINQAKDIIVNALMNSNIDSYDKIELVMNIIKFLDDYKDNIITLQNELDNKRRYRG